MYKKRYGEVKTDHAASTLMHHEETYPFGTPCLVHVSFHPTIYTLLRGISIPTFSSTEFFPIFKNFSFCSPILRVAFRLIWGKLTLKKTKCLNTAVVWSPLTNGNILDC